MMHIKPKLNSDNLGYYLHGFNEIQIESDKTYMLTKILVNTAHPTYEDHVDKRWEHFYVPIKRDRKTIVIPVWMMEYNNEFFVTIQSFGSFHIKKSDKEEEFNKETKGDKDIEKFYSNVIKETIRFSPIIKKDEKILRKLIPYDIRTGKIKGQYILDELLSQERKKTVLESYEKHLEKKLEIKDISLNQYLDIAAMCYKVAYQEKTENLSPLDMYKKWADGRDGGMFSIKDWDSKTEFSQWYYNGQHIGSHPFEIVFSWHEHGIHLYPPNGSSPYYGLVVTNYGHAKDFLKMLCILIKRQVPFQVGRLEDVIDFLTGDTYFAVNKIDGYSFIYIPSREYKQKYFPYIEWDEIKVVKWK